MYHVYAIYNRQNNKFYIGQSADLDVRLEMHNNKEFQGYTSRFDGSWEIIYSEQVESRKDALKREKQLKSFRGREFIKQHIPAWRSGSAVDC